MFPLLDSEIRSREEGDPMKSEEEIRKMIKTLEKEIAEASKDTWWNYVQESECKIVALLWVLGEMDFISLDYDPMRARK